MVFCVIKMSNWLSLNQSRFTHNEVNMKMEWPLTNSKQVLEDIAHFEDPSQMIIKSPSLYPLKNKFN